MVEGWSDRAAAVPAPRSVDECYAVRSIQHRTSRIAEVWLRPLDGPLEYLPGEYVLLEDELHSVSPRSFSIANAPRPDGLLSLLVTRVADGETSGWVHERLRIGETVNISGPYGTFVDDPASSRPALLLAAGSGLAPIRALLEAGLSGGGRRSLTLIFSARTEADVIDRGRFERWQGEHPKFRFIRTLTCGSGPPPRGRVPGLLPTLCGDLSEHDVFIAGAAGFVLASAAAADSLGARRERVHTEVFFAEPQSWTELLARPRSR